MKYKKITVNQFEKKIKNFLNKYGTTIAQYQSKLSKFFEMKIYNDVVEGYKQLGYKVEPKGIKNGVFKYKLSTNGYIDNFSFFEAEKNGKLYWIIHNLKSESSKYKDSYITVDIAIINAKSIERIRVDSRNIDVVKKKDLKTFVECKFMNPFPELLASFVGLVFCLKPKYLKKQKGKKHIGPSLVCANDASKNTHKLATKIMSKHAINIFYNMAYRTIKQRIKKREANLVEQIFNKKEEK